MYIATFKKETPAILISKNNDLEKNLHIIIFHGLNVEICSATIFHTASIERKY